MIIAEIQVKVPSKKYTIAVDCIKTRRLTAIEWLLLTCVSNFHSTERMSGKTIKSAFEQVLGIQDSKLLIKPCIESLRKLQVIELSGDKLDYDRIKFNSITLTPQGKKMLETGLLPGEKSVFSATIWYNPLTGQINSPEVKQKNMIHLPLVLVNYSVTLFRKKSLRKNYKLERS
jgi:hypothetical protein